MQQFQSRSVIPEIQEEKVWDASSSNRICVAGVADLYRLVKNFQLELLRSEADVADVESDFRLSFYGKSPGQIQGYAACLVFEPQPLRELLMEGEGHFESYTNSSGRSVPPHRFAGYDGFDQHSSHESTLFIEKFEIINSEQGMGYGRRFLDKLIEYYDPGMVFLHARDKYAERFFANNEFEHSGLLNGSDGEAVMVLNRR